MDARLILQEFVYDACLHISEYMKGVSARLRAEVMGYELKGNEGVLLEVHNSFEYYVGMRKSPSGVGCSFRKKGFYSPDFIREFKEETGQPVVMYIGTWIDNSIRGDKKEYMKLLEGEEIYYTKIEPQSFLRYFLPYPRDALAKK